MAALPAGTEPVRCVLLATGQAIADEIQSYLVDHPEFNIVVAYHLTGILECLARIGSLQPNVVLVDRSLPGLSPETIRALRAKGRCGLVGLLAAGDAEGEVAFRAWGVEVTVRAPFAADDLPTRIHVADALRFQAGSNGSVVERHVQAATHYPDRVVAVWSAAGGVGKSTLARELAVTIACLARRPTALVDVCTTGPLQAALFVDDERFADHVKRAKYPTVTSLLRALGSSARDADVVEALKSARWNYPPPTRESQAAPGRSHLDVFFGPCREQDWVELDHTFVVQCREGQGRRPRDVYAQLLGVLRQMYHYVVVDVGQDVTLPAHDAALLGADAVLVVTTASPQTVRLVARYVGPLRETTASPSKVRFVLNKYERGVGLSPDQVREALDRAPLQGVVPLATREVEAARQDLEPVMLRVLRGEPHTELTQAIEGLVRDKLAPFPELVRPSGGLLAGLFGRGGR